MRTLVVITLFLIANAALPLTASAQNRPPTCDEWRTVARTHDTFGPSACQNAGDQYPRLNFMVRQGPFEIHFQFSPDHMMALTLALNVRGPSSLVIDGEIIRADNRDDEIGMSTFLFGSFPRAGPLRAYVAVANRQIRIPRFRRLMRIAEDYQRRYVLINFENMSMLPPRRAVPSN